VLTINLEKLSISDGSVILDLGCGKGRHLHKLYYYSKCHVVGLDLSVEELKETYNGFKEYPDTSGSLGRKFRYTDRQTDRQTDRHTDRQTKTDRQQTARQTCRQAGSQTYIHAHINICISHDR